ncbi:MAG: hypothetical protein PHG61_09870 [Candidatus Marinimicrobia bacterium]|nr:hypothetical protein [Candidatus Neomarinimicrobiota bacterium]
MNELFDRIAQEIVTDEFGTIRKGLDAYFALKCNTNPFRVAEDVSDAHYAIVAILKKYLGGAKITFCPPVQEPEGKVMISSSSGPMTLVPYTDTEVPHDKE